MSSWQSLKSSQKQGKAAVVSTVYICYTTLAMNCCRVMFYVIMSSKGRTWFVVSFKPLMTHYMRHKPTQPSHHHILSCFQNHSCVDQCSFLQNTVHVQAFVKMHVKLAILHFFCSCLEFYNLTKHPEFAFADDCQVFPGPRAPSSSHFFSLSRAPPA